VLDGRLESLRKSLHEKRSRSLKIFERLSTVADRIQHVTLCSTAPAAVVMPPPPQEEKAAPGSRQTTIDRLVGEGSPLSASSNEDFAPENKASTKPVIPPLNMSRLADSREPDPPLGDAEREGLLQKQHEEAECAHARQGDEDAGVDERREQGGDVSVPCGIPSPFFQTKLEEELWTEVLRLRRESEADQDTWNTKMAQFHEQLCRLEADQAEKQSIIDQLTHTIQNVQAILESLFGELRDIRLTIRGLRRRPSSPRRGGSSRVSSANPRQGRALTHSPAVKELPAVVPRVKVPSVPPLKLSDSLKKDKTIDKDEDSNVLLQGAAKTEVTMSPQYSKAAAPPALFAAPLAPPESPVLCVRTPPTFRSYNETTGRSPPPLWLIQPPTTAGTMVPEGVETMRSVPDEGVRKTVKGGVVPKKGLLQDRPPSARREKRPPLARSVSLPPPHYNRPFRPRFVLPPPPRRPPPPLPPAYVVRPMPVPVVYMRPVPPVAYVYAGVDSRAAAGCLGACRPKHRGR